MNTIITKNDIEKQFKSTIDIFFRKINLKALYATLKKKREKAKIKASVIVEIGVNSQATPIKAKIVFVKDRNKSKNWLALISTDITLSDEEIIRIYGKRWDIGAPVRAS